MSQTHTERGVTYTWDAETAQELGFIPVDFTRKHTATGHVSNDVVYVREVGNVQTLIDWWGRTVHWSYALGATLDAERPLVEVAKRWERYLDGIRDREAGRGVERGHDYCYLRGYKAAGLLAA